MSGYSNTEFLYQVNKSTTDISCLDSFDTLFCLNSNGDISRLLTSYYDDHRCTGVSYFGASSRPGSNFRFRGRFRGRHKRSYKNFFGISFHMLRWVLDPRESIDIKITWKFGFLPGHFVSFNLNIRHHKKYINSKV